SLDDVVGHTHRAPRLVAVAGGDEHARPRRGALALVEDAHLVVEQAHLAKARIEVLESLAEGMVEGVDGAVAGGRGGLAMPLTLRRTVASATGSASPRSSSTMTRKPSRSKYGLWLPRARSMRSSKEASAPSNWKPSSSMRLSISRMRRASGVFLSRSMPYSRAFQRTLDCPASSETSTRR